MVSQENKLYLYILGLFGGLSVMSGIFFDLSREFFFLIPTLIFLIAACYTLVYGILVRKR